MRTILGAIALAIPVVVSTQVPADSVFPRAKQLHDRAIVVDSHDDTTQRQRDWITSHWGESDNKRRAKFYELTRVGRRHLAAEIEKWSASREL